jgi:putative spermidine/putrescine transport system permease protein
MTRAFHVALLVTLYALLIAPLMVIVLVSFGSSPTFDFPPHGFTLEWYRAFFGKPEMVGAFFKVSLPIAAATSVLAVLIGSAAAIACMRLRFVGRELLFTLANLPLMVPQVVLGVAMLLLLVMLHVQPSIATLTLAHTVITLPFVVNTVTASLAKIDPSLEEAAMTLGCTRARAFLLVTLPVVRAGVLSAGIMAFIISFGDINISLFLTSPGVTTIPVYTLSSLAFQAEPDIAAASALQILVVSALLLVLGRTVGLGRS